MGLVEWFKSSHALNSSRIKCSAKSFLHNDYEGHFRPWIYSLRSSNKIFLKILNLRMDVAGNGSHIHA